MSTRVLRPLVGGLEFSPEGFPTLLGAAGFACSVRAVVAFLFVSFLGKPAQIVGPVVLGLMVQVVSLVVRRGFLSVERRAHQLVELKRFIPHPYSTVFVRLWSHRFLDSVSVLESTERTEAHELPPHGKGHPDLDFDSGIDHTQVAYV